MDPLTLSEIGDFVVKVRSHPRLIPQVSFESECIPQNFLCDKVRFLVCN